MPTHVHDNEKYETLTPSPFPTSISKSINSESRHVDVGELSPEDSVRARSETTPEGKEASVASRENFDGHSTHAVEAKKTVGEGDFPDGGLRAWIIVFGAACSNFSTFGFVNSWGVFQDYYEETLLSDRSASTISWIGSIQYSLIFFPGLIVGRLFDLGYFRALYLSSSALIVLTTFLTGQCSQYWHFLLCQGFGIGLGCGGLFSCSNAIIAHWFKKKRGLALGYMAIGSAVSGATVPIAVKNLIPIVGFPWTMRILGFILIVATGICNLTMKPRLPPVNVKGGLFNFAVFKDSAYNLICASSFISFLGAYTLLTYVSVSAEQLGSSADLAFYFVAFANASSLFGRWVAGNLADRIGSLNVMIPCTVVSGIMTYVWPLTQSTASLIVVTIIYGFCSGAYVALLTNPIMSLGREGDVGRRVGMYLVILAIGALAGPPISGAINTRTGGFKAVGIYAGTAIVVGMLCLVIVRYIVLGGRLIGKA